jgi:hypothetical protein
LGGCLANNKGVVFVMSDLLHITVGAAPQSGLDLTHELRLLKAGLLYADKVTLCSLSSALMAVLPYFTTWQDKDMLEFTYRTAKALNQNPESVRIFIEQYQHLQKKKFRTRQELIALQEIKRDFELLRLEFSEQIKQLLIDANAEGLFSAIQSGLVEIQSFDFGKNRRNEVEQYISAITKTVLSGDTYPLLDDETGSLVKLIIEAGKIVPLGTTITKAKQAGLSSSLFEKLPLFDEASVDDIIQIRKELDKPLTRFRSAIAGFSRKIEHEPWEKEFPHEVEQIFIEHVEPAILEIDDAYKSNKFIFSLVKKVADKPLVLPSTSAIGLLMSQASNTPNIITQSLSLAAGGAIIGLEAVQDWRQKNQEIEKNQLYFYYRVKKSFDT